MDIETMLFFNNNNNNKIDVYYYWSDRLDMLKVIANQNKQCGIDYYFKKEIFLDESCFRFFNFASVIIYDYVILQYLDF